MGAISNTAHPQSRCVGICVRLCVRVCVCMYMGLCVCVRVCTQVWMCVDVCVHMCTDVHGPGADARASAAKTLLIII